MKTKTALRIFFFLILSASQAFAQSDKSPRVYINNNKTEVTDGMYINCLKIDDLTVNMPISDWISGYENYDLIKLELHRFGDDIDIITAYKTFDPAGKEFQKKYASKESIKFKVLAEEDEFGGSDLEVNTLLFPAGSTVNMAFCKSHDLKHCSFYLIVRGYKKTGEKTRFNEDVYDKGTDLTTKSVVFKSWESKTK